MKKLSISRAWDETAAFVKQDFGRLFLISFGLVTLPSVIFQTLAPQPVPGQSPEPGAWMLLIIPAIAFSILGTLTLSVLAVGLERQPADAFARAVRRLLPVLAAIFIFALGVALCALPVLLLLSLFIGQVQTLSALFALLLLLAFAFLWVRMILVTPVGAVESGGPATILKRSWQLTRSHFWQLLGFVAAMLILLLVISLAVTAVFGSVIVLLAGPLEQGSLSTVLIGLLGGLLNAILVLYFTVIIARIYAQLSAGETSGT